MIIYSSFVESRPLWFAPFHSVLIVPFLFEAVIVYLIIILLIAANNYKLAQDILKGTFDFLSSVIRRFGL